MEKTTIEIYPEGAGVINGFVRVLESIFFYLFFALITGQRQTKQEQIEKWSAKS